MEVVNLQPPVLHSLEPQPRGSRPLRPEARRIAMMHIAGMEPAAIARMVNESTDFVRSQLATPKVQDYVMKMESTFVEDLRPVAERVNAAIESHSMRAAEVIFEIMEDAHAQVGDMRAQQVALASATDILDRAGHKPTLRVQSQNLHAHTVSEATLTRMAEVLAESRNGT